MKRHPIAVSAVAFFLLATGCQKPKEEIAAVPEPKSEYKKRNNTQTLTLEGVGEQNVHGGWQGKSAPYLHTGGFSVEADFIYWRADEDGLDYVLTNNGSHTVFHKPGVNWDPGFKVGVGYTWGNQDFWDLFVRWTYLNTHQDGNKKTSLGDASNVLTPVWSPAVTGQEALSASATWQMRYNTWDLEMGRDYFISKTLALRPHMGLRGASIRQHYDTKYLGVINLVSTPVPIFKTGMKAENSFWGIGARAGAQLNWHFTRDWSVIGSVSGSLLYGHFDLNQKINGVLGVVTPTTFHFKDEFSKVATNLEAGLGFEWETFFCDDDYRVAISLSYEFSEWFSQNRMKEFELFNNVINGQLTGTTWVGDKKGDLGLQGGTLRVRFDF